MSFSFREVEGLKTQTPLSVAAITGAVLPHTFRLRQRDRKSACLSGFRLPHHLISSLAEAVFL